MRHGSMVLLTFIMLAVIASHAAPAATGGSGTWVPAGSMETPRLGHTATLLDDGRVLVAGGNGSGGALLASAELYDPATGSWGATASMNVPRSGAAATLMPDGQVLVAGGNATTSATGHSSELYSGGQWRLTGSMSAERAGNTSTLMTNGEALVFGGGPLAAGASYDPSAGTWVNTNGFGSSPPELGQTETVLPTGEVMVVGGVDRYKGTGAVAHLYDPSTNRWQSSGSLNHARSQHTATRLYDGQILVTGGELKLVNSSGSAATTVLTSAELYTP